MEGLLCDEKQPHKDINPFSNLMFIKLQVRNVIFNTCTP